MKTFKQFLQANREPNFLDVGGNFARLRRPKVNFLDVGGNFARLRQPLVDTKIIKESYANFVGLSGQPDNTKRRSSGTLRQWLNENNNAQDFEEKVMISERDLSSEQRDSIEHYSKDGHDIMNSHLRGDPYPQNANTKDTKIHIDNLNSVFSNAKNRIKIPFHSFSGVHHRIGTSLMNSKKGTVFHMPTFVSSSTNKDTAYKFSHNGAQIKDHPPFHVIHFMSDSSNSPAIHIAEHSDAPHEDEVLISPGAKITYLGTDTYEDGGDDNHPGDHMLHVHKVKLHPHHESLPFSELPGIKKNKKG